MHIYQSTFKNNLEDIMKINKNILFFSLFLILLLTVGAVSAEARDTSNKALISDDNGDFKNFSLDSGDKFGLYLSNNDMESCLTVDSNAGSNENLADNSNIMSAGIYDESNIGKDNDDKIGSADLIDSALMHDESSVSSKDDLSDFNPEPMAYMVTVENINYYFKEGVLDSAYDNSTLIFQGVFDNLGILRIPNDGTVIGGFNAVFNNTVFSVEGNFNTLSNVSMYLDKSFSENDYAAILIHGRNNTISNVLINYTGEKNVDSYPILADGSNHWVDGLKIFNNTIFYQGNSKYIGHNYAIRLIYANDANVTGNRISCQMPLRTINREIGTFLQKEFSAAVGIRDCDRLTFADNYVFVNITGREGHFPTVDGILIASTDNSIIKNNTIEIIDFFTPKGTDNYIYGIDVFALENLKITGNSIFINTTGGKYAYGTAYPIQLTGPLDHVDIVYNSLISISNGPNIGVYSHNFYGDTALNISSNFINITGYAGEHNWALVTGIEVQDSNDIIFNNTIYVQNIANTSKNDNLYAISYAQKTNDNHTYNIQNNTLHIHDGKIAIRLLRADNSLIMYNTIVANNLWKDVVIDEGSNNTIYRNFVISEVTYYIRTFNNIDGSEIESIVFIPDVSGTIDGKSIRPVQGSGEREFNFKINPNPSDGNGNGIGNGGSDGRGALGIMSGSNGANPYSTVYGIDFTSNMMNSINSIISNDINGVAMINSTTKASYDGNSSYDTPGLSGSTPLSSKASSSSSSEGSEFSNQKAYEIEKNVVDKTADVNENNLLWLLILFAILLYVGYKTKKID